MYKSCAKTTLHSDQGLQWEYGKPEFYQEIIILVQLSGLLCVRKRDQNVQLARKYARIFGLELHVKNDIFDVVPSLTST